MLALIAIGTILPSAAAAQVPELQRGLRVRVDATPPIKSRIVGTLISQAGDTLSIVSSSTTWHRVRTNEIRRIEVSRGNSRVLGALKGVLIGGIAPAAIALMVPKKANRNLELTIGVAGGVLAGAVGCAVGTESWQRVYPPKDKHVPDRDPVR